jgi:formamidopyrimidine-DNA glycosylase
MPELPEVEVTVRGIQPGVVGRRIEGVIVRHAGFREPVPERLADTLTGLSIESVTRRGKFILVHCVAPLVRQHPESGSSDASGARDGTVLVHLGMTGTLRVMPTETPVRPHDHVDVLLGDRVLRFNDPRRFGLFTWHPDSAGDVLDSASLRRLGVEPLSALFAGAEGGRLMYLASRGRSVSIKQFLLAGEVVVGVGNIYASESLFRARIDPRRAAGRVSRSRYADLAGAIRDVLGAAIEKGGSTLRDFVGADGSAGYFQLQTCVYDREGEPCRLCGTPIRRIVQQQRSTFFCPHDQR